MRDALHRALRADRHERRRLDVAVAVVITPRRARAVSVGDAKANGASGDSLQSSRDDNHEGTKPIAIVPRVLALSDRRT